MVDVLRHFEHVDRQFDIHVALDPAPPHRVGEFLGRFGYHCIAVIVEPVHQWPDWRILLVLDQCGIIECSDQASLGAEQIKQSSIVDVECKAASGGIEVGTINEYRNPLFWIENHRK